jgi:hypothetical protein
MELGSLVKKAPDLNVCQLAQSLWLCEHVGLRHNRTVQVYSEEFGLSMGYVLLTSEHYSSCEPHSEGMWNLGSFLW